MLRFSANLSLLFSEYPWPQRFQVASRQGFKAVEIQFPYQLPAQQLQALLQENALQLILFNVAADTLLEGGEGSVDDQVEGAAGTAGRRRATAVGAVSTDTELRQCLFQRCG